MIGDIPAFEKSDRQTSKQENEAKAMRQITDALDDKYAGLEMVALWQEFEKGIRMSQFANAMDKVEVLLQHNVADIKTWGDGDFHSIHTTEMRCLILMNIYDTLRMK